MLKNIFDFLLAALWIILILPVFVVLAILIKLESRGPVFFKHLRVGKDGRLFFMFKFRKMPHGSINGPRISPKYDLRLTKVGRVMERLKLDEIPQLINVLRGEMSFVGPRPEIPEIVDLYTPEQREILSVRPGLVGPCQLRWRNEKDAIPENVADVETYYIQHLLPQKLEIDLAYVRTRTLASDFKFLFLSFFATVFEPFYWSHWIERRRDIFNFICYLIISFFAFLLAYAIKSDFGLSLEDLLHEWPILIALPIFKLIAILFLGVYRLSWRYLSKEDLILILKAISASSFLGILSLLLFFNSVSTVSLLVLDWMLSIYLIGAIKLIIGYYLQRDTASLRRHRKNVLIYGAGKEGELLLRRVQANLEPLCHPVGFLDVDAQKRGMRIHNLEVLGNSYDLPLIAKLFEIKEIYVTCKVDKPNDDLLNLISECNSLGIKYMYISTTFVPMDKILKVNYADNPVLSLAR